MNLGVKIIQNGGDGSTSDLGWHLVGFGFKSPDCISVDEAAGSVIPMAGLLPFNVEGCSQSHGSFSSRICSYGDVFILCFITLFISTCTLWNLLMYLFVLLLKGYPSECSKLNFLKVKGFGRVEFSKKENDFAVYHIEYMI